MAIKVANPANLPQISTVITPGTDSAKPVISSRERHPYTRLAISEADIKGTDGHVDVTNLVRILGLMQDNVHDATLPQRSHPLGQVVVVENQVATSGKNLIVRHGMGQAFRRWGCKRVHTGSAMFSASEAAKNGGMDPTQYLVLAMGSSGTYDIEVYPS